MGDVVRSESQSNSKALDDEFDDEDEDDRSMPETTYNGRIKLSHISPEAFISPTDRLALQNLQKLPLLPLIIRKFNEFALDRMWYAQTAAESIRCGPNQFSTLYGILREGCEILHVPVPELYVQYSDRYNAYTSGLNRTYIVLHSSMVQDFSNEELLFILGHELGHIKCGHLLYSMVGRFLIPLMQAIGQATFGIGQLAGMGLISGFYEWMRQAEFSCDRAGLLVCQDRTVALTATMKMGCGATRFNREMNLEAFMQQARTHTETTALDGAARALMFLLYTWQLDHPQVVFRAKELEAWALGGAYDRIVKGDYTRDTPGGRIQPEEEPV
jgi:Zn-dependent protease with chaperone function